MQCNDHRNNGSQSFKIIVWGSVWLRGEMESHYRLSNCAFRTNVKISAPLPKG